MPTPTKSKTKSNKDTAAEYAVVIIGDDGNYYKLLRKEWHQEKYKVTPSNMAQAGVINQLRQWGTYLAYLPTDVAAGVSNLCTLVNLEAVLKNNIGNGKGKGKAKRPGK
jgi:hypothetical protein